MQRVAKIVVVSIVQESAAVVAAGIQTLEELKEEDMRWMTLKNRRRVKGNSSVALAFEMRYTKQKTVATDLGEYMRRGGGGGDTNQEEKRASYFLGKGAVGSNLHVKERCFFWSVNAHFKCWDTWFIHSTL